MTKAVEEITKKASERITTLLRREYTESNTHRFDNTMPNADNVAGIYLFVEKILSVQEYNYGSRYLLSVTVPRPSEGLVSSEEADYERKQSELEAPPEFNIVPDEISEGNYDSLAAKYKASGVDPPPPQYRNVTHAVSLNDLNLLSEGGRELSGKLMDVLLPGFKAGLRWGIADAIKVPDGYAAFQAKVVVVHPLSLIGDVTLDGSDLLRNDSASVVYVNVAGHVRKTSYNVVGQSSWGGNTITFDGETEEISLGLTAWSLTLGVTITIDLECERTDHGFEAWRLDTYEKLYAGYLGLLEAYQEKVAVLKLQRGNPNSVNPSINRFQEHKEIKARVISAILEKSGIVISQDNYTELYKFFELAIEWENIAYKFITQPQGRHEEILRQLRLLTENDLKRNEFLRAQGAMVIVPVRTEYAASMRQLVLYGLTEGIFQNMEDIAFVLDIMNDQYTEGSESPEGDPFEVALPTSLVYLKEDDVLPDYEN